MKIDETKPISADVIDRRLHPAIGFLAGLLASLGIFASWKATQKPDPDRDLVEVVSTALDEGQAYWSAQIMGYQRAKVVIFDGSTSSGCGQALARSGPFWCGRDNRIYVDLEFLRAIDGNLARAYVLFHELGHAAQGQLGELRGNPDSIAVELNADCKAGVMIAVEQRLGHLDQGDIEAAIAEAAAVGDDRLCPDCSPESWSHGSAAQRVAAVQSGIHGQPCHL